MSTPNAAKTFRFENDSLKRTECTPMLPGKTRNSFAIVAANATGTKKSCFEKMIFENYLKGCLKNQISKMRRLKRKSVVLKTLPYTEHELILQMKFTIRL